MWTLPSLECLLALSLAVAAPAGAVEKDTRPPPGLVVYQAFENAAYSLRIEPDRRAAYFVWSTGIVRERREGILPESEVSTLRRLLEELPPLPRPPAGRGVGHAAEMETDRFILLGPGRRIAGSLRRAPSVYADPIARARAMGASLPALPVAGEYLMVEEGVEDDGLNGGQPDRATLNQALRYPYSPFLILPPETATAHPAAIPPHVRIHRLYGGAKPTAAPRR